MNLHREGKKFRRYVHHLVLETFGGPRPQGLVCRHLDGNPANNVLENLEWGTYAENEADKLRHGTRARGETARSKLSEEEVLELRRRKSEGVPTRVLASDYGVTTQNIEAIVCGKSWKHLLPSPIIPAFYAAKTT